MTILCILFTLILGSLEAQAYTPPVGFRGIPWGTLASTLQDELILVQDKQDEAMYLRPTDKLSIGDAQIIRIVYRFYKGQFFSAYIQFEGEQNGTLLKEVLLQTHGVGVQPNRYLAHHAWGLHTPVTIQFDYTPLTQHGGVLFMYHPIFQKQLTDQKKKGKAAGKDL